MHVVTKDPVVIIDAMALIVVAIGTAEAVFQRAAGGISRADGAPAVP
jgi:hypothetical protein